VNGFVQARDRLRAGGHGLVSPAHRIRVADSSAKPIAIDPCNRRSIGPDRRPYQQMGLGTITTDTYESATMGVNPSVATPVPPSGTVYCPSDGSARLESRISRSIGTVRHHPNTAA
jgi:hypothetical protein